jgi:hypothetical protein
MPIDCQCSDCDNSAACGGPDTPGAVWTGVSEAYEYTKNSGCKPEDRSPQTPVAHVERIQRVGSNAQCNWEDDLTEQGLGFRRILYRCDDPQPGMVTQYICSDDSDDCSSCFGADKSFSITMTKTGACLKGGGFGAAASFMFEPPTSSSAQTGTFTLAMAPCFVSGHTPILTPAPTPNGVVPQKDTVGLGVGLGLGIPACAAAMFFFQKRRKQQQQAGAGTTNQELLAGGGVTADANGGLGEMYSQL